MRSTTPFDPRTWTPIARKASEEVADFRKQIADLKQDVTTVKGDVALLKWMTGFLLAANLAILVRLFA